MQKEFRIEPKASFFAWKINDMNEWNILTLNIPWKCMLKWDKWQVERDLVSIKVDYGACLFTELQ